MRICFLTDIKELGGGEVWVIRAGKLLRELGHTISVTAPLRSPLHEAARAAGFDLFCYDRTIGSPFYAPLYHFLKRHRVDIVYCTLIGGFWEAAVLKAIARQINEENGDQQVTVILKTGLPPLPNGFPGFYGAGLPEVRRLHVVSTANAQAFREMFGDLAPADYVEVHREGVDLEVFDPTRFEKGACRVQWQIPADSLVLTCLGRLRSFKGQEKLLLAASELCDEGLDFVVVFAGDGPDRARLESLTDELSLRARTRFLGQISGDLVPALLAATDIICLPSTQEGLPNALVESAAMGVPIVATALGGVSEIVEHEKNGFLIPSNDVHILRDALRRLISDPELRRRFGPFGRRRVEEAFNLRNNVQALASRLEEEQRAVRSRSPVTAAAAPPPVPILFLLNTLRTGGEETEVELLSQHLDPARFRVSVMSCFAVPEPSPTRERLREQNVSLDCASETLTDNAARVGHIRDYIRREGIRVVVASQDPSFGYAALQQIGPGECALIEHGGIVDEAHRIPKDRTARYVGVSPAITTAAAPLMPVAGRQRALTIPSMVDPSRFPVEQREGLRRAYGFAADAEVILFVGRLDRKKGIEHLISAANAVLSQRPNAQFLIVGPPDAFQPDYAAELFAKAAALSETGRFGFLGARGDVPHLMVAADLLVLPSQDEGMSHVIEEAGAAGLAVIAAADGFANEQLLNGKAGVLIAPGEVARLGSEIMRLLENSAVRAELGAALRARVLETSSVHQLRKKWEEILTETIAELPEIAGPNAHILTPDHVPPFPREIQIQTNTFCNATCVMCPYPKVSKEVTNGKMSEELYTEILAQCAHEPGVCRIEPFLMNEPFTDKRLVDFIAQAKRTVPHAWVTVTTNGSLVRPEVTDRLVHSGLDAIWFSFNGATRETFERIMGVSYDRVVANIDYLLSVRPPSLQVFTNMIETKIMAPEVEENIRRWHARGVGSGTSVLVNRGGNVENYDELNYRPRHHTPIRICDLLYHKMYVLYNGDVVLCCMDWRRQVVMGNVHQQSLREIWRGERYRHYRKLHEEGRSQELDLCRTCSFVYN
jgi:radical SAM protein with 4Fe4S-binding SPASM domain